MTILDTIVADTIALTRSRKTALPASTLRTLPCYEEDRRPFAAALAATDFRIIAEIKKRSPSAGTLRSDLDVATIARGYSDAGAAAISVLTEPFHFHGEISYLHSARTASSVPILRKDFVVDPYQVLEARAFGADAVLLIATILSPAQIDELVHVCAEEQLGVLLEVYSADELNKFDHHKVQVIGANNRDLTTFEVDTTRCVTILQELPQDIVKVAESGLRSPADIAALQHLGMHAFLVGERFMRDAEPWSTLRNWMTELTKGVEPS